VILSGGIIKQNLKGETLLSIDKPTFLWDLDGTIFDTKACHYKTWQFALNQYGLNLEQEIFNAYFGRNNHASLPYYLGYEPEPDFEKEIVEIKESYFREIAAEEVDFVPGALSWLKEVKERNFSQALASSAPLANIQTLFREFNLYPYFDAIISGEHLPAKPHPDIFLKAAHDLGELPQNCWVVEDSLHGIEAGKKAGMICLAVSTTHPFSELSDADLVLQDFTKPLVEVLKHFSAVVEK